MLEAVVEVVRGLGMTWEIVAVDDGSTDDTLAVLEAARADLPIRLVPLCRNFGKEAALTAGMDASVGDAVVFLDGDLQHPPGLIPAMVEKWREGFEVVHGVREEREREPLLYRTFALGFYRLFRGIAGQDLRGHSDFKLLDRQVVDALRDCPERNRFFRGLVTWVGFRTCAIPLTIQPRAGGATKWSFAQLFVYSLRSITSFSSRPLYWIAGMGLALLALGIPMALLTFYRYFAGQAVDGFTTVILLLIILCGFIIFFIGIIAVYLAQLFDEVKNRPTYIVRKPRG